MYVCRLYRFLLAKFILATFEFLRMYVCTGFSLNSYAEDTSGYIVGTYNISNLVKRKSRDKKTHCHKGCGWLAPRRGSKY
jgi:hypothetical protein